MDDLNPQQSSELPEDPYYIQVMSVEDMPKSARASSARERTMVVERRSSRGERRPSVSTSSFQPRQQKLIVALSPRGCTGVTVWELAEPTVKRWMSAVEPGSSCEAMLCSIPSPAWKVHDLSRSCIPTSCQLRNRGCDLVTASLSTYGVCLLGLQKLRAVM